MFFVVSLCSFESHCSVFAVANFRRNVRISEIDGDGWKWYTVASFKPGEDQLFWFASGTFDKAKHDANPDVESVLLDQIEISRIDD